MLKKLLAMATASVMMLSCFGGIAAVAASETLVDEFTDLTKYKSTEYGSQFNNASWSLNDNYGLTAGNTKQLLTVTYEVEGAIDSVSTEAIYTSIISSQTEEEYVEDLVFYLSADGSEWTPLSVNTATESKSTTYSGRKMQKRTFTSGEISGEYSLLKVTFPASAVSGDIDGDGIDGWKNRWYLVIDSIAINYTIPGESSEEEEGYADGDVITSKIAGASDVYEDSTATNGNYSTTGDTTTKKRVQMSGIKSGQSDEAAATYYALLNSNNGYERDNGWLRLSAGNSSNRVLNFKGHLVQIDGSTFDGYKFYSNASDLYARFSIIDKNAASGANYATDSSKGSASTMTYEFEIEFTENFFDVMAYVSTAFSNSDSGRNINALKIDTDGKVWSTASNFAGSNPVEIAQLTLGEKYKFGIVVKLTPSQEANKYSYKMDVHINSVKKYSTDGSNLVQAGNTKFYGFEMDFRPWTVDTEFDYTQNASLSTSTQYAETGSGSNKAKYLSASVTNEYSIIDTVTTVSNFYVYAGNMYEGVKLTYSNLDFSDLSSEDSNYVTENLTLPTEGENGATIEWASSNEDVLGLDGTIDFSQMESYIEKITLTATITSEDGSETKEKTFDVVVVKDTSGDTDNIFVDTFYNGVSKIDTEKSTKLWPVGTSGTASGVDATKDMKLANDGPTNYWYSDGWAINAVTLGAIPELVYSFERPFKSFFIDTFYCSRNSAWPTDFTFEVSENGTSWTAVSSDDVTVDKATAVSPGGYYAWKFTVDELESTNNKYLKVIFGDNAATLQNFTIALDNVTVNLQTDVEATYNGLDFSDLSGESIDAVTQSLTLPTTGIGDAEISWESSDESVISTTGVVNTEMFTGYRKDVTLTATIAGEGDESKEKVFNISVVKDTSGYEDMDFVTYDLASLDFTDLTDQPIDMLAADINLPEGVSIGSSFEWSVTESPAATLTDNVLSFTPQNDSETELTLTVTATYGSASDSREFPITVVRGFGENNALSGTVSATSGTVNKALSRDVVTYWESAESDDEKTVTVAFDSETEINSALIVEKGENITNVEIKTSTNGTSYETVYSGAPKGDLVREAVWFMPVSCKYVQFVFTSENPVQIATLELYNTTICDEQLVDYSLSELTLPTETSTNLTLPAEGSRIGTIAWATSDEGVISAEGVITRAQYEHKSATLTATISCEGVEDKTKEFTVKVLGTDVPQEPKSDVSFTFVDNLTDYSKIYQSSTQYTSYTEPQEGDDTPLRLNNQPTTSVPTADGWFLQPMKPGYQPWLVYKFDDPIYGFKIDTLYTRRGTGGVFPTDFTFFLSADGSTWTQVGEEYITATKVTDIHTAGYYPWTFEASNLPAGNYYLKIVFGDSSGQGTSAAGFSITLDTVTISHLTAVSQAYNAFEFSDLSDQQIYEVTDDLTLPLTGIKDTTITWTSSDPAVLSNTGVINTDEFIGYSIDVDLTAKIEVLNPDDAAKAGEPQEKVYTVTVRRDVEGWNDSDFVNYDLTHLFLDSFTDQPAGHIATDIHLPTGFEGGSDFTWAVSESAAAKLNGYVATFTPQYTLASPVTLTVTAAYGTASATKDFPVTVVRAFADNLILGGSISATSEGIRKALSRDVVTYWESGLSDTQKTITVGFPKATTINSGLLVEVGNNISNFKLEVSSDGNSWDEVYSGASNGNLVRRAYSFDSVECKFARIILTSAAPVKIATVELYNNIVTESQAFELSLESLNIPTTTSTDLVLPTAGAHIGTITWTTSDASVITAEGKVSRALNKNQTATLTATLTYGGMTKTKSFEVTVTGRVVAGTADSSSSSGGGGGGGGGGAVSAKELESLMQETVQQPSQSGSFSDVPESHWAYSYITELAKSGVISAAAYYRPSDLVTREEFVKLIIEAIGGIRGEAVSSGFSDTDAAAWYYPYILAAHDMGIVTGNADGSFGIGASITRQDAAAMLYRAIENKTTEDNIMTFTDGDTVSVYAAEAVNYLANAQIINGYEDGSFRPFNNLTRAESAKIIYMLSTLAKEDSDAK